MAITHFITHHFHLNEQAEPAVHLRETELAVDDLTETLAMDLKRAYLSRVNRQHGQFSRSETSGGMADGLAELLQEKVSFSEYSVQLANQLLALLKEHELELRGHLVLFQEQQFDQQAFYLFIVNQRIATRINEQQAVEPVLTLDLGASLMAIKVDLSQWQADEGGAYLSLTASRAGKGGVTLLEQLAGFSEGIDKAAVTRDFLERIELFSQNLPEEQVNDYRSQVVSYCMEKDLQDEPVEIGGLSQVVEGVDPSAFSSYLADNLPSGNS
ncbi:MAG: nucleoid-associated protein, partial [Sedimenticola sp.]|nr:nucleoid-associated protein [Sedimenticola sp.]